MPMCSTAGTCPPPGLYSRAWLDDPREIESFTRWQDGTQAERIAQSSLRIGGMHCAQCADIITQALRQVPGVIDAQVSAASQCASVRWDSSLTRPSALVVAVVASGYEASPDTAA